MRGTIRSIPINVTCTRGKDVTMRPFPSFVTSAIEPVSATAKLHPVIAHVGLEKGAPQLPAREGGQRGRIVGEGLSSQLWEKSAATSSRVLCKAGPTMCDGVSFASCKMYSPRSVSTTSTPSASQRFIEMNLLGDHRLRLNDASDAVVAGDPADDLHRLAIRLGKVDVPAVLPDLGAELLPGSSPGAAIV